MINEVIFLLYYHSRKKKEWHLFMALWRGTNRTDCCILLFTSPFKVQICAHSFQAGVAATSLPVMKRVREPVYKTIDTAWRYVPQVFNLDRLTDKLQCRGGKNHRTTMSANNVVSHARGCIKRKPPTWSAHSFRAFTNNHTTYIH